MTPPGQAARNRLGTARRMAVVLLFHALALGAGALLVRNALRSEPLQAHPMAATVAPAVAQWAPARGATSVWVVH